VTIFEIANMLDTDGKYLEADVVLDSMIRLARDRFNGQQTYYGNTRKSVPFKPLPGARSVPVPPAAPVAPPVYPSSPYNPDPFGNYSIRDTIGYVDPGDAPRPGTRPIQRGPVKLVPMGSPAQPATAVGQPRTQVPKTDYNLRNNEIRKRVFQNPKLNPQLAAVLELEQAAGRFDPRTGELAESAVETLSRAYEKIGPSSSAASRGGKGAQIGAKAAQMAARAKNSPAAGAVVSALEKMSGTLKFIRPIAKLLPFVGFALAIPDFVRLCNRINQDGWEAIWNDAYDRAKAIGVIANTVAAAVSIAPGPLTPVAAALSAIGMGSDLGADVARDAGDAAEGGEFKLFGKTLKQKSKQRQQQDAFEAGLNAKTIDPQVQSALQDSKNMLMNGSKIIGIINDPRMKSIYPWIGTSDARDTQFRVQLTSLRKSLRSGGGQLAQQQGPLNPSQANQQGQSEVSLTGTYNNSGYNNSQQQRANTPKLNSYNDLLYKAYTDVTSSSEVTLNNLKNYRDQIINKIQALSSYYPNINAQQAITALDNRIRKYSTQASPA
jgi:hypothetical protein